VPTPEPTPTPDPDLTAEACPDTLWPPNHKMVPVKLEVSSDYFGPDDTCKIISVSSNEPEDGVGDGHHIPDWEITGDLTVDLRAERSGIGSDRIYTITVECTDDASDITATATAEVLVPHDQKEKKCDLKDKKKDHVAKLREVHNKLASLSLLKKSKAMEEDCSSLTKKKSDSQVTDKKEDDTDPKVKRGH